jgi:hypothetical protein
MHFTNLVDPTRSHLQLGAFVLIIEFESTLRGYSISSVAVSRLLRCLAAHVISAMGLGCQVGKHYENSGRLPGACLVSDYAPN